MWVGGVNRDVGFSMFWCAQAKIGPDQPLCLRDANVRGVKSLVQSLESRDIKFCDATVQDAGVLTSSTTNGQGRGVCGQRKMRGGA